MMTKDNRDTGLKGTNKKRECIQPLSDNRESYFWPSAEVKEYDEVPDREIFWRIKIPINFDIEICQFGPLPTQYNKKSHIFQCFGCGQYPDVYRVPADSPFADPDNGPTDFYSCAYCYEEALKEIPLQKEIMWKHMFLCRACLLMRKYEDHIEYIQDRMFGDHVPHHEEIHKLHRLHTDWNRHWATSMHVPEPASGKNDHIDFSIGLHRADVQSETAFLDMYPEQPFRVSTTCNRVIEAKVTPSHHADGIITGRESMLTMVRREYRAARIAGKDIREGTASIDAEHVAGRHPMVLAQTDPPVTMADAFGPEESFVNLIDLLRMPLTVEERDLIRALYDIGQHWNARLECISDGDRVYVPHWGPLQGFTAVDYFHGMIRGRPMAQLMDEDESDVSVMLMISAMPGKKLDRMIKLLEQQIRQLGTTRFNNRRTALSQKLRHTQSALVPEIMKYIKPTFTP